MLLRWCDPALVAAVKAAEAPFAEDQVKALGPCILGGAAPALQNPPDLGPNMVDRIQQGLGPPWNALVADLCSRIMVGRIQLAGVPATADAESISVPIPLAYVNSYDFNFATDTVTWYRGSWHAVTASLNTEAASLDEAADHPLPLNKALLTWCDDALVDRYETAHAACQIGRDLRQGPPRRGHDRLYAGLSMSDLEHVEHLWGERREPARTALHADFRARVANGKIELIGLQTEPVLATKRSRLPPVWAERMRFDWQRQTVRVEGTLFVDVTGAAIPPGPKEKSQAETAAPRKGPGRPGLSMAELVVIAGQRLGKREPTNKGEANVLCDEFRRF